MKRVYNFYAGPATLPLEVLERVRDEFLDFSGTGMSIVEISHRSKECDEMIDRTTLLLREVLGVPNDYHILYIQGGASLQFTMLPMNILLDGKPGLYVNTGAWSSKAIEEGKKLLGPGRSIEVIATSEEDSFKYIPNNYNVDENGSYLHITSNNTIYGTQWQSLPETDTIPLVCDMSSDIASRPVDVNKFGLIYAGAQKNIGTAGVTVVIIREDLVRRVPEELSTMLSYRTFVKSRSLHNTPPVFQIYLCKLIMEWVKQLGGLTEIEKNNVKKSDLIYKELDESNGFYRPHAHPNSRSRMNITFRLPTEELENKFVEEATRLNFIGLKGHRSVGGCRASIYNAFPLEGVIKFCKFMQEFRESNS